MDLKPDEIYARLYDASVPDWPGEVDFYLELARHAKDQDQAVLEVACGTGRVGLRLAQAGAQVTGVDISAPMLEIARMKNHATNVSWVEGDMRDFDLNQQFGLAIIPGHSFQFMLTPYDQLRCLENVKRHLTPDGRLVVHLDHQDMDWLGSLVSGKGGVFDDKGIVLEPQSGARIRTCQAWSYRRVDQTARSEVIREQLDDQDQVLQTWRTATDLHCVFRFEMAHLFRAAGFEMEALYGDFFRNELSEDSSEMIWLARPSQPSNLTPTKFDKSQEMEHCYA